MAAPVAAIHFPEACPLELMGGRPLRAPHAKQTNARNARGPGHDELRDHKKLCGSGAYAVATRLRENFLS